MIFSRIKKQFTFPIYVHAEYELNFIENGAVAKRVVGDSIENIENKNKRPPVFSCFRS
ncbi:hypothetical protein M2451_001984 [Dysgonomonas sp. PFB1-18]|nr:hypothetical protein [Dysgonomonas sp. PF1-14]MDH6339054.1 hypothetical protein [Dysgonomonas sp. PF1-16]MDH6380660.1 hypothetical protein [Dysgonomonas sp. PFB1-18]MDH6398156.1 hypothetical protein [Dysgonomonas sp. PF1-23]